MIARRMTITLDGQTREEYEAIVARIEAETQQQAGWKLIKDPLVNRVTATRQDFLDEHGQPTG